MKYYFITYQATNKDGSISLWQDVIEGSPMKFIKQLEHNEQNALKSHYHDFLVLNTCEITEDEFCEFMGSF